MRIRYNFATKSARITRCPCSPYSECWVRVVTLPPHWPFLWWRAASWCGYITRRAIANERLALNRIGYVVLTLKTPY